MAANTRLASALQILCVLACKGPAGTTSDAIARSLRTNPVVVLRLLKVMQRADLVALRPGRDGGVRLGRPADAITLDQVRAAVDGDSSVFALRPQGNPNCPVDRCMPALLTPIFGAADDAIEAVLRQNTLASLVAGIDAPATP